VGKTRAPTRTVTLKYVDFYIRYVIRNAVERIIVCIWCHLDIVFDLQQKQNQQVFCSHLRASYEERTFRNAHSEMQEFYQRSCSSPYHSYPSTTTNHLILSCSTHSTPGLLISSLRLKKCHIQHSKCTSKVSTIQQRLSYCHLRKNLPYAAQYAGYTKPHNTSNFRQTITEYPVPNQSHLMSKIASIRPCSMLLILVKREYGISTES
jgi:hypothetical protein